MAILVGFTATLLLGGWFTLEGTMAVGAYSVLVFMTQRLLWPLTRLGETFDLYQRAMASSTRVLDVLASPLNSSRAPSSPATTKKRRRPFHWSIWTSLTRTEPPVSRPLAHL